MGGRQVASSRFPVASSQTSFPDWSDRIAEVTYVTSFTRNEGVEPCHELHRASEYKTLLSRLDGLATGNRLSDGNLSPHGFVPNHERFGLTSQLRRAAVSVPSNIAEGQGRLTRGEFRQFLGQARGSLMEIETQITIAHNLGYLHEPQSNELLKLSGEVGRMLNGLVQSIR